MGNGRIRSIKPEWRTDEHLKVASDEARVLSVALITMADDYGNGDASDLALAGEVWGALNDPLESLARVSRAIRELTSFEYVLVYRVNGQKYFHLNNWKKHQRVDHPGLPRFPGPQRADIPEEDVSGIPRETLASSSGIPRERLVPDKEEEEDKEKEKEEEEESGLASTSRDSVPANPDPRVALAKALPGAASLTPAKKKKLLLKHIHAALELWEYQNAVRKEALPRSRPLEATAERVARVAARLEAGASPDDCRAVLGLLAAEAKSKPAAAQWFNGETNWRGENFDRNLGRVGTLTPEAAAGMSPAQRIYQMSEELRKKEEESEK